MLGLCGEYSLKHIVGQEQDLSYMGERHDEEEANSQIDTILPVARKLTYERERFSFGLSLEEVQTVQEL